MLFSKDIVLTLEIEVTTVTHKTLFLVLISPSRSERFNYHLKYHKNPFFQGVPGHSMASPGIALDGAIGGNSLFILFGPFSFCLF